MTASTVRRTRTSRLGRTRRGSSTLPWALGGGVAGVLAMAVIVIALNGPARGWPYAVVMAPAVFGAAFAAAWVLVVDRASVRGAVEDPESSAEAGWYDAAALGSFHDLIIVMGLGLAALVIVPGAVSIPAHTVLLILLLAVGIDILVPYQVLKRRALG